MAMDGLQGGVRMVGSRKKWPRVLQRGIIRVKKMSESVGKRLGSGETVCAVVGKDAK
jgi:hypothetical protein